MTKKGPLGTAEKFYVKHNYSTTDIEQLCKELDRPKGLLNTFIEKCRKEDAKVEAVKVEEEKPAGVSPTPPENEFSVFAQVQRNKGATVMTQEAAELADEIRKNTPRSVGRKSCITKIR